MRLQKKLPSIAECVTACLFDCDLLHVAVQPLHAEELREHVDARTSHREQHSLQEDVRSAHGATCFARGTVVCTHTVSSGQHDAQHGACSAPPAEQQQVT